MSITKTREVFSLPNVHYAFLVEKLYNLRLKSKKVYYLLAYPFTFMDAEPF